MFDPVLKNPWVQAGIGLGALALVVVVAYALQAVLIPLFLAFLVAYVLDPVVDYFETKRIPRIATIAALWSVAALILISIPFIVIPMVYSQGQALVRAARTEVVGSNLLERVLDKLPLNELVHRLGLDKEPGQPSPDSAPDQAAPEESAGASTPSAPVDHTSRLERESAEATGAVDAAAAANTTIDRVNARALLAEYIGRRVSEMSIQFLQNHAASLATMGQRAGAGVFDFLRSVGRVIASFFVFLANFALFAIVAGYLLKDFDPLIANARNLLPPRRKDKILEIVGKIDVQLRSFLRGQFTVCLCLGTLYTIGFLITGTPFAILIGAFGVVASFIPFVGVATIAATALLLTVLQYGLDWHVLGVLAVIGIVQALEGNLLTPKIVGDQIGLSPVWVILAILVFGNLLGFLGLLIAVPTAAALKVLVVEGVEYYKRSPLFEGGEGGGAP